MYSVVIVDDEKLVIESLKRSSIWEKEGFEVIGQAQNGIEACELIAELNPDVVFTDIQMPGINGLELMMKINETPTRPLFVIISGYPEFAYAQKGMALGAVGYCLKPFNPNEISNILKLLRQKLDHSREEYVTQLAEVLNETHPIDEVLLTSILQKLNMNMSESTPLVAVTIIGEDIPLSIGSFQHIIIKIGLRKRVLLIKGYTSEQCFTIFKQITVEGIEGVGISRPVMTPEQLVNGLEEAELGAYQYFIYGKGHINLYFNDGTSKVKSVIAEFSEGINKNDITKLDEIFDEIGKKFITENGLIKHAYLIYICVMGHIYNKNFEEEDFVFTYQQMVHYYRNFENMLNELKDDVSKWLQNSENDDEIQNGGVINEIIKHIKSNFYKDINIQSISRNFRINPSYLCSLFKKKTGTTFTSYLNKCRIAYAAELLKTSDLPIGDIAEKSGYDNCYYFSKLFKRTKGMTPSHYRIAERGINSENKSGDI